MANLNVVPNSLDLIVYGGDDTVLTVNVDDDQGNPIDLTGQHSATIRPNANSVDSWAMTVTQDNVDLNKIFLTIPAAVAAEVVVNATAESIRVNDELVVGPMFVGVWDWQMIQGGVTKTMLFGGITVIGEVTK